MPDKNFNLTILEEGFGAVAIATCIVTSPLTRSWYSKWGATETEVSISLPGDGLVPNPVLVSTRAITIQAPATAIWPWLVESRAVEGFTATNGWKTWPAVTCTMLTGSSRNTSI